MPNKKISELSGGTTWQTGDAIPIARGGSNFSLAAGLLAGILAGTISANAGSATLGGLTFSNSNGVSFGISEGVITASHNGLTGFNVSAGTVSQNLSALTFFDRAGAGGVTFGLDGAGGITASHNGLTSQSIQQVAAGGDTKTFEILPFADSNNVSFGFSGNSVTANAPIAFRANADPATLRTNLVFSNANGVTFGLETNGVLTASVAAGGGGLTNIKVSAGTLSAHRSDVTFADSNGISFGLNTDGVITASYTVPTQSVQTLGFYAVGNTTQNSSSTFDARTVSFNGLGGITVGFSNGSVQISGPQTVAQSNQTLGIYGSSNTTGQSSSSTVDARSLTFRGAGAVSVGMSGGEVVISANAGGGAGNTLSEWCPYPEMPILTSSGLVNNSLYFNPFDLGEPLNAYRVNFFLSVSTQISASNNTKSGGYTLSWCLYQRGAGASSTRLESVASRSAYISFTASSHTRIQIAHPAGILNSTAVSQSSTSGAATNTSTYVVSSVGGFRVLPFPLSSTLTPGRYWMAVAQSSVSANAQGLMNCSVAQQTHGSNIAYMPFGTASKASNASWPQIFPGRGVYSATSAAFPGTVALTTDHIRALATTVVLPFFNVSGYTTATNVL